MARLTETGDPSLERRNPRRFAALALRLTAPEMQVVNVLPSFRHVVREGQTVVVDDDLVLHCTHRLGPAISS